MKFLLEPTVTVGKKQIGSSVNEKLAWVRSIVDPRKRQEHQLVLARGTSLSVIGWPKVSVIVHSTGSGPKIFEHLGVNIGLGYCHRFLL